MENSHPAIIERDMWELVQVEMKEEIILALSIRPQISSHQSWYVQIVVVFMVKRNGIQTSYERFVYQCNKKVNKDKDKCHTPNLTEEHIKEMFVNAYNDMMKNKSQLIEDIQEVITLLTNTIELDIKIASQRNEIDVISELIKKIVTENARKKQDQEDYNKRYSELVKRYDKAKLVLDKALEEKKL